MNRPAVLVPGASGQIGIYALPLLLAGGFDVLALSRHGKPRWYPEFDGVTWANAGSLSKSQSESAWGVLSCGPLSVAIKLVSHCSNLKRFVAFSTSSTYSKRDSADRKERAQIEAILMDEETLSGECSSRNIELAIFRPTLIYGCGMDLNVSRLARWIERCGFLPIAGDAQGLRQPVHAQDIAQAAVSALALPGTLALDSPLCGGSTLSYQDMAKKIFLALDRRPRLISLPSRLLMMVTAMTRLLPALRGISPEMVRRQARDMVYDDSRARSKLGYFPRPFEPSGKDFQLPGHEFLLELASGKKDR